MSNDQPWNKVVEPQETTDSSPMGGAVVSHPAYAQIRANRVSGRTCLYGSDFVHQNYIKIGIYPSTLRRTLSNDRPHAESRTIVEVELSEAQWAEFVSSLNTGSGTQCTLKFADGEYVPGVPAPRGSFGKFEGEADELVEQARRALDELDAMIAATSLSKAKQKELHWKVEQARRTVGSSAKFVRDQFGEHMERTINKARMEINAYATHAVTMAGLDAISANKPIVEALPHPENSND